MKIKEILEISDEDLEKEMTQEEFDRMQDLGIEYTWELLDALKDSARESEMDDEDEYITISAYLDYLEEMKKDNE
nr:MAG TPA: hypothetical protein [Caudoviricetes sp.]